VGQQVACKAGFGCSFQRRKSALSQDRALMKARDPLINPDEKTATQNRKAKDD